jgi:hypothetical protein
LSEWRTFDLHGARRDANVLDNARITTRQVDDALAPVPGCNLYQVVQGGDGALSVLVVPDGGDLDEAGIVGRLEALGTRRVRVKRVERLPTSRSMKYPLTTRSPRAGAP